jgi:hypothetical protein
MSNFVIIFAKETKTHKMFAHKIKRFIQKQYIFLKKFDNRALIKKQQHEKRCFQICQKLIHKEGTVLLLTPVTEKRYIKNDILGMFIVIHEGVVKITNHTYSYVVFMEGSDYEHIIKEFNEEVEERRLQMEKEINTNIKHSLDKILESLS